MSNNVNVFSYDEINEIVYLIYYTYGIDVVGDNIEYIIELIELEFELKPPRYLVYKVLSTTLLF